MFHRLRSSLQGSWEPGSMQRWWTCLHGYASVVSSLLLKPVQHILHIDLFLALRCLSLSPDPNNSVQRISIESKTRWARWKERTTPNNSATPHPCTHRSPTSSGNSSSQVLGLDTRTPSPSVSPRGQPASLPRSPATPGNHSRNARRRVRGRGFQ